MNLTNNGDKVAAPVKKTKEYLIIAGAVLIVSVIAVILGGISLAGMSVPYGEPDSSEEDKTHQIRNGSVAFNRTGKEILPVGFRRAFRGRTDDVFDVLAELDVVGPVAHVPVRRFHGAAGIGGRAAESVHDGLQEIEVGGFAIDEIRRIQSLPVWHFAEVGNAFPRFGRGLVPKVGRDVAVNRLQVAGDG